MTRIGIGCLAVLAAAATTVNAQTLGGGAGGAELPWWRVVGALGVCLVLAVGLVVLLRRRLGVPAAGPGRSARRLQLLETVRLSHQTDICLLRCDGEEMIVAASPHGPVLVKPPAPVAGSPA